MEATERGISFTKNYFSQVLSESFDLGSGLVVEFLIKKGADINLKNKDNESALDIARRKGIDYNHFGSFS